MQQLDVPVRVRYDDADPMGFLHHSKYLIYFEMGRTELLRAAGGNYRDMEDSGLLIVVVKAECRYRKPARYDDQLIIRTRVTRVSMAKIEHDYQVLRGDDCLATGNTTLAVIDRQGKVQPVPEWLRAISSNASNP